jgi:hypothetical protein
LMFLTGEHGEKDAYVSWLKGIVQSLPTVYHFSWIDIERKIRLYRDFWTRHWNILYTGEYADIAESNNFFDCKWSEVTDSMISNRAKELALKTGGWVFHKKWDGTNIPCVKTSDICDAIPNYK